MDRRKVLLGSGAAVTTLFAGCASQTGAENGADNKDNGNAKGKENSEKKSEDKKKNGKHSEEKGEKKGHEEQEDKKDGGDKTDEIPGFDPAACEIDSELIHIKELSCHDGTLIVRIVVKTEDREKLLEELSELAPALERGITDVEAFFAEVDEMEFTLQNESKETLFAIHLDVMWFREFVNDNLSNEELMEMAREEMEQE
ncbi:hypothetical protein GWG54_17040 [Natronococcus sp. JC468]|uniref:hypothetical protein n=1 Tax=Natronococcus sp. JC468 TaxID=1961921 RepID=UPI001438C133|nr:hypothetical protein [Natronococcus sp. JC468]NKE37482.1 hypothetical protein [Natronococcus sp. JC468]